MTPTMIGIGIAIVNVIIVIVALVTRLHAWNTKIKPKEYVRGVGVRYSYGGTPWKGMESVMDVLYLKLTEKYGAAWTNHFLNHVWVEVVGPTGERITPTTVVGEKNRIAGSMDQEWLFPLPFFRKYYVAVVLQRKEYPTANDGAIFHEIDKHIVPLVRGQGINANHSIPEYNQMEDDMHKAYLESNKNV